MAEFGHLSQVMPRLATVVMLIDLVPIRKFAYIFDRRHFGMIGTVTQRDTSLELGSELYGQPFEGGGPQNLEGGGFSLGCQGNDRWHRSTGNAGALCAGSWLPKICDARFGIRRSRMHLEDLVGKLGLPHGHSLFISCSRAATSCKIGI